MNAIQSMVLLLYDNQLIWFIFQKLLDELNTNVQNVSAKAASNEIISRVNQVELAKLQKSEKLQKSSNNNGGLPSTPKVINNHLNWWEKKLIKKNLYFDCCDNLQICQL